jgi:hypothetical protein
VSLSAPVALSPVFLGFAPVLGRMVKPDVHIGVHNPRTVEHSS